MNGVPPRALRGCVLVVRAQVDARGLLKLADFGLACEKKGVYIQTRSNLAGTPRYMAPESVSISSSSSRPLLVPSFLFPVCACSLLSAASPL
jgi:serine/threonine protein kinase